MVGRYPTNKLIGRNPLPQQHPKAPFTRRKMSSGGPFGITHRFQRLFRSEGYVGYVLLTLSPLYSSEDFRARLACLIHTASVRSEPGSNPSVELIWLCDLEPEVLPRHAVGAGASGTLALKFKSHPVFKEPSFAPLGAPVPLLRSGGGPRQASTRSAPGDVARGGRGSRGARCGARCSAWRRVEA